MIPIDCLDLYADAEFYDIEFATRDHEIPFFRKYAYRAGGPVLEVACGTGRITLPIARDGIDITGLDISLPMLERARLHSAAENLRVKWVAQDCREMRLDTQFALILTATNAMQHLHDAKSVCAFLQSARKALLPDGLLIIDVFHPDLAKLVRDPATRYPHKTIIMPDGTVIEVEAASRYHADTQILHFDLYYTSAGRLLRTKHVNMRCFYPEELLALCRMSGLDVVHRFGNYDESTFSAKSPKQILFCKGHTTRP